MTEDQPDQDRAPNYDTGPNSAFEALMPGVDPREDAEQGRTDQDRRVAGPDYAPPPGRTTDHRNRFMSP